MLLVPEGSIGQAIVKIKRVCLLSLPFSAEDSAHVQDHYTLLERQIIIEVTDTRRHCKVEHPFMLLFVCRLLSLCCC